jgi:putative membrane protein
MKKIAACTSLLFLAVACAPTERQAVASMATDPTPTAAPGYVAMAGSSDLYEIESSRMALQQAPNAAVKQFAQMMIAHHTGTTQQVMQAARSAGMTPPPPSLLPPQRAMLDELRPLRGAAFERMYLQQQRTAHAMALQLHQNYAASGDTASLRQTAGTAVPIVQSHIDQLGRLPSN